MVKSFVYWSPMHIFPHININILIQIYIRIVHLNIPIHYIYIQVRDINIHTQLHWKDRSKTSKGSWETIFGKQTFYYI